MPQASVMPVYLQPPQSLECRHMTGRDGQLACSCHASGSQLTAPRDFEQGAEIVSRSCKVCSDEFA
jgi:hypothetical protein